MNSMNSIQNPDNVWTPSPRRWLVLTLCSLLFTLSQFFRVSNAIIAPRLQLDLSISSESLGVLGAVFFYSFALTQIPLGLLLDRIGARLIMSVLSMIGAIGAFLFATAHDMPTAVLGRTLLGIGMAGNFMGSLKLFTNWFSPRKFATLSGVILGLGSIGNMVAATPLAVMVNAFGWRWSFICIGIITFLLAVVFFFSIKDQPENMQQEGSKTRTSPSPAMHHIRLLITSHNYWVICFSTFLRYGIFVAIQGLWAGPYLIKGLGFSPVKAGNFLLLLNIGYIIGSPLSGWLSDRVIRSPKRGVLIGVAIMAWSIYALSKDWCISNPWILGGVLFTLGTFSAFGILMYAHIKELMPPDMSGMAFTGINLFTMLGGAVVMQVMGVILDHLSTAGEAAIREYHLVFFYAFLGTVFALVIYFFTKGRSRQDRSST
ncbi:MAG: MFS transporter [Deltaproteobacteria bacterium]|nr:MFS transporter [Deltaproteobacteria bacterium]